jgi:anti-sigma B factor antagonist
MRITKREVGGVAILEMKGKVTIGIGDVALRDAIDDAVDAGARTVVLDFKQVSKMDSSAIGELVAAHKRIVGSGGQLKLVNMPGKLFNVLGATQMVSVLDVLGSQEEALASVRAS